MSRLRLKVPALLTGLRCLRGRLLLTGLRFRTRILPVVPAPAVLPAPARVLTPAVAGAPEVVGVGRLVRVGLLVRRMTARGCRTGTEPPPAIIARGYPP